jgi:bifunctional UDP-N-acetylglucosamine pyrophosphorylase / glucosamine-1-phosphate N-acetyltransferase
MNDNLEVIILAAGLGTRMKSGTIKILHRAAGRPIIDYVLDLAADLSPNPPVMVVGYQREAVQKSVGDRALFAVQEEQKGTGHAVLQAAPHVDPRRRVLILSGDVPLTRIDTLRRLLDEHAKSGNALTLLTMKPADAGLYGRIVRDGNGAVTRIVEAKDASDAEKLIDEVNAGIYVFDGEHLFDNLRNLKPENAQKEYYLTDLLKVIRDAGHRVGAVIADDPIEALGVNSRAELAQVENEIQHRVVERLMSEGVTFRNPSTVVIDSTVTIGPDTVVYPFVTLEGTTRIGEGCVIDPGVHLNNVTVGDDVHLKTGTVAEDAIIEDEATVGPYAHLRPGTRLGRRVKVGNFVETKKATFGEGAKASHL